MFEISVETYRNNNIEVIVDCNGILWLNENNIEEKLSHENLTVIAKKYDPIYRKHKLKY